MTYYFCHPIINLKSIPISLMTKLVAHSDLFVMQTEYSIYVLLKYWIYMLVHSETEDAPGTGDVNNFFCSRKSNIYDHFQVFLLYLNICR